MPLKLSKIWRRPTKKNALKAFESERDAAESEPASPRQHSDADMSSGRPWTTNDEVCHDPDDLALAKLGSPPPQSPALEVPIIKSPSLMDASSNTLATLTATSLFSSFASNAHEGSSTVTPAGPGGSDLDRLSQFVVKVPVTQVLEQVEESFGQTTSSSLGSSKWDKRVQALKGIGAILRSLDLGGGGPSCWSRDGAACWRTTCLVLHHTLRDNVMPVRLASHDLFCVAFTHVHCAIPKAEVHAAMRTLLGGIIERLGDSNIRLHESARSCVLFCARVPQLVGLRVVLTILKSHLDEAQKGRERTRVSFGIIDTVNVLLRHFLDTRTSASWTQEEIVPFVLAGLDDALGPRTRSCAIKLAVTLRLACGCEALQPVISAVRPSIRLLLLEQFVHFDDDNNASDDPCELSPGRADAVQGLVVRGTKVCVCPPIALPGANDDEEAFLDDILEETGMVFGTRPVGNPFEDLGDIENSDLSHIGADELSSTLFGSRRTDGVNLAIDVF